MRLPVRLLKRGCIGFLLGAALFAVIFRLTGSPGNRDGPNLAQLLFAGFYGAACMAGTVLYEIEEWPLLKSTVLHMLITVVLYVPMALLSGWAETLPELLISIGVQLAVFFLIWLFMYLRYRAEVRKLSELLKREKGGEENGL